MPHFITGRGGMLLGAAVNSLGRVKVERPKNAQWSTKHVTKTSGMFGGMAGTDFGARGIVTTGLSKN